MSKVIDFKSKQVMSELPTSNQIVKDILQQLNGEINNIKDIIVFTKYNNDEFVLHHSGATIADKSLTVQLLQHDIMVDITEMSNINIEFTPDNV